MTLVLLPFFLSSHAHWIDIELRAALLEPYRMYIGGLAFPASYPEIVPASDETFTMEAAVVERMGRIASVRAWVPNA